MPASEGLAIIDIILMYTIISYLPKFDMTIACIAFTIINNLICIKLVKDKLFQIDWKLDHRSEKK